MYKNYSAHAIKGLSRLIDETGPTHDKENMGVILKLLIQSEKFLLPLGGKMLDDGLKGIKNEELHLPYPIIALEFDEDKDTPQIGPVPSSKRVALCVEGLGVDFFKMFKYPNEYPKAGSDRCIFIQPISYLDEMKEWYPSVGGLLVPIEWDKTEETGPQYGIMWDESSVQTRAYPIATMPTVFSSIVERYGMKEAVESIYDDAMGETFALLEFLEALSCSNITSEKTSQTKASTNAKRMKQGKLPLYDYHCLTVKVKGTGHNKGPGTGTHASPRQHLRRGHIRRLPDKKVWVNSCVVGSHGKIDKDYRLI